MKHLIAFEMQETSYEKKYLEMFGQPTLSQNVCNFLAHFYSFSHSKIMLRVQFILGFAPRNRSLQKSQTCMRFAEYKGYPKVLQFDLGQV